MPETFIIYRRKYDKNLREKLADRYTKHSPEDCDLANEWWDKFNQLSSSELEIAKSIIALNKFDDNDFYCNNKKVHEILNYYKIKR